MRHFIIIALFLIPLFNFAQKTEELIDKVKKLMEEQYVFLDKAKEVNVHLDKLMKENYFDDFSTPEALARAITQEMRKVTNDNHLGVYPPRVVRERPNAEPNYLRNVARYYRPMINGFQYFENNVGYFDMRFFGGGRFFPLIDDVMAQLSMADAIIIDLRYSSGGSPMMVQYLASYFFEKGMLLTSIYSRYNDHTNEYWTVEVEGKKRLDVPVFILTSSRTFSAAEGLPYTMQARKRATIVGAITRGGAHPTRTHNIGNGFRVGIPFAMSINPVTKSNWEGTGVIPNVEVPEDEALEKAKELASEAALKYKASYFDPIMKALDDLNGKKISQQEQEKIHGLLEKIVKTELMNENDINSFGYNYLRDDKALAALAILKSNTLLHPSSPNVFDSYAEALQENGQQELALKNFEKAVKLAKEQNHESLERFQRNLESVKKQIKPKKVKKVPVDQLRALLDTVYHDEQDPIRKAMALRKEFGLESPQAKSMEKIIHENHAVNIVKVKKILDEYGWLGADRVGKQGNRTLFLVIQHSDLETQVKYAPMLRAALERGDAEARHLAYLEDRIASKRGKKQIYGSQIKFNPETKTTYVWPLEDPKNVDKRRADIGLPPLAPYIKERFGIIWDLEEHLEIVAKFEKEQEKN